MKAHRSDSSASSAAGTVLQGAAHRGQRVPGGRKAGIDSDLAQDLADFLLARPLPARHAHVDAELQLLSEAAEHGHGAQRPRFGSSTSPAYTSP